MVNGLALRVRWLAVILFWITAPGSVAHADALADAQIGPRMCELTGEADLAPSQVLSHAAEFRCGPEAYKHGSHHIWLIADIADIAAGLGEPVLRTRIGHHGAITVHVVRADGSSDTKTYAGRNLTALWRSPSSLAFPLGEPGEAAPVKLVIGVDEPWDLINLTDMAVIDAPIDRQLHMHSVVMSAFFCGLLFAPLLLNAFFYAMIRRGFILFYFCMIAQLLVYSASWSGLIWMVFPGFDPIARSILDHHLLAGIILCACLLVRDMCEPDKLGPFWRRALLVAGLVPVVLAVVFMSLQPRFPNTASLIFHMIFVLPLLAMMGSLLTATLRGSRFALAQLVGWTPVFCIVAGRILRGLGLIENMAFFDYGFFPSVMVDVAATAILVTIRAHVLWREREAALQEQGTLRALASTDPLTGLLNRRSFESAFEKVIAAGLHKDRAVALAVLDLDHFKRVNDTHGHAGGDAVLVAFAQLLERLRSEGGAAGRLGGEEFAILVDAASATAVAQRIEDIRVAIAAYAFPVAGRVTASIGLVHINPEIVVGFDAYFRAADAALYAAKSAGRNRVRQSGWSPEPVKPNLTDLGPDSHWEVRRA